MTPQRLKQIVEAALFAADTPLTSERLLQLFEDRERPPRGALDRALLELAEDYAGRGIALVEVASGWRVQVRAELSPWVGRLWEERAPRYSRALLETLALIVYRQPITRGEIEEIRGVSVSTNIIRTLLEREWVRVVGHRDVPGRPALYATTRRFLDYFGLRSLNELPPLAEIREPELLFNEELALEAPPQPHSTSQETARAVPEQHNDEE
ncbi:SMC-Scp complex subunit ScpB [Marichromatium bheemlicum]|uniref:SMC-Scp complex subunit ScpB n=1 Tax=Marichromatium bheemlicum TaxID=365339 RepID=A0ABX1IAF1_9GAMM|nr:SMC-Scp complex subunit ScpB [Marichromatium bheemlicum]NKN33340.1 SMC-Scp complex subunit ScpB [Marichromatium bheemlicum]